MKIVTHDGQQFTTNDAQALHNYLKVEIAAPNAEQFTRVNALVDSGATATVLSTSLIEKLGINSALPFLGNQTIDTANGTISEPTTKVQIRVIGSDGSPTLFQDVIVTLTENGESVIGMDLIQFFSTQVRHGIMVYFVFDPKSPAEIQKRQKP